MVFTQVINTFRIQLVQWKSQTHTCVELVIPVMQVPTMLPCLHHPACLAVLAPSAATTLLTVNNAQQANITPQVVVTSA